MPSIRITPLAVLAASAALGTTAATAPADAATVTAGPDERAAVVVLGDPQPKPFKRANPLERVGLNPQPLPPRQRLVFAP